MRITLNKLIEQINHVNDLLTEKGQDITINYYQPDYYPGIIINSKNENRDLSVIHSDRVYFSSTKTEVHTALTRVIKLLWSLEDHKFSDKEICGIFAAAFWR